MSVSDAPALHRTRGSTCVEAAHFVQGVGEHSEDIAENRDEKLLIKYLCNIRPVCIGAKGSH
jgi:hypothetical protein